MHADAYRRARTLMGSHSDLIVARVLGAIQSLLLLWLLGVICLFVALMASRGEARFPRAGASLLPAWAADQGVPDGQLLRFQNTGFFPWWPITCWSPIRFTAPGHGWWTGSRRS